MFATAYAVGTKFTFPIIQVVARHDGKLGVSLGAGVLINEDGWALTAWHIVKEMERVNAECAASDARAQEEAAIRSQKLSERDERRALRALKKMPRESAHTQASIFGVGVKLNPSVTAIRYLALPDVDLAAIHLSNVPRGLPTALLKDPTKPMPNGTSLCKLGFPFHEMGLTFDATTRQFNFATGAFPIPFFPLEGILTRLIDFPPSGTVVQRMIETSSAGLRGQSGGPIMDAQGGVWSIQSATSLLDTGFDPPGPDGRKIRQFHSVGIGPHAETITGFLRAQGIAFSLTPY